MLVILKSQVHLNKNLVHLRYNLSITVIVLEVKECYSKFINMRTSFKDLDARSSKMKTIYNLD
jgi:hypothetical protein